jgi:hypothetical protein
VADVTSRAHLIIDVTGEEKVNQLGKNLAGLKGKTGGIVAIGAASKDTAKSLTAVTAAAAKSSTAASKAVAATAPLVPMNRQLAASLQDIVNKTKAIAPATQQVQTAEQRRMAAAKIAWAAQEEHDRQELKRMADLRTRRAAKMVPSPAAAIGAPAAPAVPDYHALLAQRFEKRLAQRIDREVDKQIDKQLDKVLGAKTEAAGRGGRGGSRGRRGYGFDFESMKFALADIATYSVPGAYALSGLAYAIGGLTGPAGVAAAAMLALIVNLALVGKAMSSAVDMAKNAAKDIGAKFDDIGKRGALFGNIDREFDRTERRMGTAAMIFGKDADKIEDKIGEMIARPSEIKDKDLEAVKATGLSVKRFQQFRNAGAKSIDVLQEVAANHDRLTESLDKQVKSGKISLTKAEQILAAFGQNVEKAFGEPFAKASRMGAEGVQQYVRAQQRVAAMPSGVDPKTARKSVFEFNLAQSELAASFERLKNIIGIQAMPGITAAMNAITAKLQTEGPALAQQIGKTIGGLFTDLAKWVSELKTEDVEKIGKGFETMASGARDSAVAILSLANALQQLNAAATGPVEFLKKLDELTKIDWMGKLVTELQDALKKGFMAPIEALAGPLDKLFAPIRSLLEAAGLIEKKKPEEAAPAKPAAVTPPGETPAETVSKTFEELDKLLKTQKDRIEVPPVPKPKPAEAVPVKPAAVPAEKPALAIDSTTATAAATAFNGALSFTTAASAAASTINTGVTFATAAANAVTTLQGVSWATPAGEAGRIIGAAIASAAANIKVNVSAPGLTRGGASTGGELPSTSPSK